MNGVALAILALGMSMDGFAASVAAAAGLHRARLTEALRTGVVYGAASTLTPLLGWGIGASTAVWAIRFNPWIAFILLGVAGVQMAVRSFSADRPTASSGRQSMAALLVTGFATSLDALAVGVSLALIKADIVLAAVAIGGTTCVMAMIGTLTGRWIGPLLGRSAHLLGGLCLVGIGTKILLD
jgi:manganese efflux pump family protein